MTEMFIVQLREAVTVVDGLAYDKHRSEGEVVVVHYTGQVR